MLAYGANPELAKFLKGNESGLWAKQAEQAAAALQGLKPEYHVWQSGGAGASKDPLLDLAAQLMPVMQIVGNKMLPAVKATTDALRAS
jgi:gamma-glutamyl:cysteine ligase YbdK (ATP-grasp superfamily)